jgi:hypothetical protein
MMWVPVMRAALLVHHVSVVDEEFAVPFVVDEIC